MAKARRLGVIDANSCAAAAEPLSGTACGELPALSAIDSVALNVPVAVGVNVTEIVQVPPNPNELHVFVAIAKLDALAPVMLAVIPVRAAVPLFASVIDRPEFVVFTNVGLKVSEVG